MEVVKSNFEKVKEGFVKAVESASVLSFDLEFTGVP